MRQTTAMVTEHQTRVTSQAAGSSCSNSCTGIVGNKMQVVGGAAAVAPTLLHKSILPAAPPHSYGGCWAWSIDGSVTLKCLVRLDTTSTATAPDMLARLALQQIAKQLGRVLMHHSHPSN